MNGIAKAYLKKYNGTWSNEVSINENAHEDKCLRTMTINGELYLYYINNNKIYKYNIRSDLVWQHNPKITSLNY